MSIVFSIIIPHKNCLSLLRRCISSIPNRDDVEIIVIDDNSNENEKPLNLGSQVKVIQLSEEESKGAGRARNVGLSYAQGKWILFADADDYYTENLQHFLEDYKQVEADVIYYNANLIDVRQNYYRKQKNVYSEKIIQVKDNPQLVDEIKYMFTMPWNKMVSKEFIDKYRIQFEEVIQGNDIYYSYQVGYLAQEVLFDSRCVYNYLFQDNTITNRNWNKEKCICFLHNIYKANEFKKFLGYNCWRVSPIKKLLKLLVKNYSKSISILCAFCLNYRMIKSTKDIYVKSICRNR